MPSIRITDRSGRETLWEGDWPVVPRVGETVTLPDESAAREVHAVDHIIGNTETWVRVR